MRLGARTGRAIDSSIPVIWPVQAPYLDRAPRGFGTSGLMSRRHRHIPEGACDMAGSNQVPFGLTINRRRRSLVGAAAVLLAIAAAAQGCAQSTSNAGAPSTGQVTQTPAPSTSTPALVAVPNLSGMSRAQARAALVADGMTVGQVTKQPSRSRAGTILRQSTGAGTKVQPGSVVNLVVAGPLPRVPNVIGRSKGDAVQRLKSAGFAVGTSTRTVTNGANGVVLSESPSGGTPAMPGTRVNIVVSVLRAPPPPPPPPAPSCTTTSSGTCIRGGEFCPQASYGMTGYDANGTPYTCTGDTTHPHWE